MNWTTTSPFGARPRSAKLDPVEPVGADPAQPRAEAVGLAAGAEAGRSGQEGERGDEEPERGAQRVREAERVGERRPARARPTPTTLAKRGGRESSIGPFAEARLHELEVGEARQAVAPAEGEADRQLRRQQPEDHPPAREDGDEREERRPSPG